jgi:hypothetical protein
MKSRSKAGKYVDLPNDNHGWFSCLHHASSQAHLQGVRSFVVCPNVPICFFSLGFSPERDGTFDGIEQSDTTYAKLGDGLCLEVCELGQGCQIVDGLYTTKLLFVQEGAWGATCHAQRQPNQEDCVKEPVSAQKRTVLHEHSLFD